jgi:hypothetical protein
MQVFRLFCVLLRSLLVFTFPILAATLSGPSGGYNQMQAGF